MQAPQRVIGWFALALLLAALLMPLHGAAQQQRTRGMTTTEQRVALVIGNAAYRRDPLDNPVNDARLIAGALKQAGFEVTAHENLDRAWLVGALREFGSRLGDDTIAVLYYAGHGLQLRDRNYLIPVDAEIRSEDEIPIAGVDLGFILGRMSQARSRINIVILDACRNNPFAAKAGAASPAQQQGLAQMDAPVGTLLAFATAPGKVAADGTGGTNSLYAAHIARHLPTPGLPVELMFKRVREAVVRETRELQVPWESSSLQGEFAFVPGVSAGAQVTAGSADAEATAELAFWNSLQAGAGAGEYRAYLRQYPRGRFVELAQLRVAAIAPAAGSAAATASPGAAAAAATPAAGSRAELLPRAGDTWRYRVQDRFRLGDLFVTARVDEVTAEGVSETWTTTSDAKVRTTLASVEPGFHALPGWTLTPPEFAPYLQASGLLRDGQKIGDQQRRVDQVLVPLKVSVEGEEELSVPAGRFRAIKLVLRGQAQVRAVSRPGPVAVEQIVWYAPQTRRIVRSTVSTRVGAALTEATVVELMEYRLH